MYSSYFCLLLAVYSVSSAKISPQIIGGSTAYISSYQYQVALQVFEYNFWNFRCGGAILSNSYILTAAHCTDAYKYKPSSVTVRAGSQLYNSGGQLVNVNSITQHPDYDSNTSDYDIAILKLDVPLTYTTSVKAIGLALSLPSPGSFATIAGWGATSDTSSSSTQLIVTSLPLMSYASCQIYFSLTANMFCAGYDSGSPATCNGDSGGSLVYGGKIIGLVSFGKKVCTIGPTVFTNVPSLSTWIKANAVVD